MMKFLAASLLSILVATTTTTVTEGFVPPSVPCTFAHSHDHGLRMVKYDGEKWIAESDTEVDGYGIAKSAFLHGPIPAFKRIFQSAEYEQAVLKFMATEQCDRNTAQGNMDAYLRNPNDWFATRSREEKMGFKMDYVTLRTEEVVLRSVWSIIVLAVAGRLIKSLADGDVDLVDLLFGSSHQFDFLKGLF